MNGTEGVHGSWGHVSNMELDLLELKAARHANVLFAARHAPLSLTPNRGWARGFPPQGTAALAWPDRIDARVLVQTLRVSNWGCPKMPQAQHASPD